MLRPDTTGTSTGKSESLKQESLGNPICANLMWVELPPKKGINIKKFARFPPPLYPPLQGTRDPANSLCLGGGCPSKHRKKPKHKEFFGGGFLGGPKFSTLTFFKRQGKPQKQKDFIPTEPRKSLEKKGGNAQKTKNKEFPRNKEGTDRFICQK